LEFVRQNSIHLFDMSAVSELAMDILKAEIHRDNLDASLMFLPAAPYSWLETSIGDGWRHGFVLSKGDDSEAGFGISMTMRGHPEHGIAFYSFEQCLRLHAAHQHITTDAAEAAILRIIRSWLLLINSPKVIERTICQPHRGLARALRRPSREREPFALLPWHEIVLHINPKAAREVGMDDPDHVTGKRALHRTGFPPPGSRNESNPQFIVATARRK